MPHDRRPTRDVHALDDEGMVLCNPRDREAAHRAAMGDIATADGPAVTCPKCRELFFRRRWQERQDQAGRDGDAGRA
jgi:hypothetical protein